MDKLKQLAKFVEEQKHKVITLEAERDVILYLCKQIQQKIPIDIDKYNLVVQFEAHCLIIGIPMPKLLKLFPEWDGKKGYFK